MAQDPEATGREILPVPDIPSRGKVALDARDAQFPTLKPLRPPEGARVLAHTSLDPNTVIEFGPRQWGVQFHPEFDRPILQDYVEARREILIGEGFDPNEMIESVSETPGLTSVLRRFAQLVSGANGRTAS